MKRYGNLYPKIYDFDNLLAAFYQARKGKRNKPNVAAFEVNLEYELLQLHRELKEACYTPGSYTTFFIHDPKKRMISAAPFRDRVVHHALCQIIEPLFEPSFIYDTYANRKGKGTHAAIKRCQHFMRQNEFVLKCDIQKYFPSIDHAILKAMIAQRVKCSHTLNLISTIIDHSNTQEILLNYFVGDDLFTPVTQKKGLPMGNLTSQFFANLYLSPFDHFVKQELSVNGYIRYVDDFVLLDCDKDKLKRAIERINGYLARHLRLCLHPHKTHVVPTEKGLSFLGQHIFKNHRLILGENMRRFNKRMAKRMQRYDRYQLSPQELEQQLNSWRGHLRQADTWRLQQRIFKHLRFRERLNVVQRHGTWLVLEPKNPIT